MSAQIQYGARLSASWLRALGCRKGSWCFKPEASQYVHDAYFGAKHATWTYCGLFEASGKEHPDLDGTEVNKSPCLLYSDACCGAATPNVALSRVLWPL